MTQCTANFETGTQGNSLSASDTGSATAFDSVQITSPGTLTYDNAHVYGTLAAKVVSSTATSGIHLKWTTALGTLTDHFGRIYVYFTTFTGLNAARQVFFQDGSNNNAGQIRINSAGKVELIDGANTVKFTSTNAINLNAWTRIEWHMAQSATVGHIEAKIFLSPDSVTATETVGDQTTNLNNRASVTQVQIGATGGNPTGSPTFWMDNIVVGATSYPGPATTFIASPVEIRVPTRSYKATPSTHSVLKNKTFFYPTLYFSPPKIFNIPRRTTNSYTTHSFLNNTFNYQPLVAFIAQGINISLARNHKGVYSYTHSILKDLFPYPPYVPPPPPTAFLLPPPIIGLQT